MTDDFKELSEDDLAKLYSRVLAEIDRRNTLKTAAADAEEAGKRWAAAAAEEKPRDISALGAGETVGPTGHVIIDGIEWENVSGAFLSPVVAGPKAFPQGWQKAGKDAPPSPPVAPVWQTGVSYKTGDLVSYNGVSWKCIQAHRSQTGWNPSAVPALWARE